MTPDAPSRPTPEEEARANGRLVGQILGACGAVLAIAALVAWAEFLPFSKAAARALTILLAVTSAVDLIAASFFMMRSRQ